LGDARADPSKIRLDRTLGQADRRLRANAGYRIAEKLDYAPNSRWLESASGTIADALRGIDKLESLPHVENGAPQMFMQSVSG
jgi:hypothetical protein